MNIEEMIFNEDKRPTVEQVKAVWESFDVPSSRKVVQWFARKQVDISFRTICNYKTAGWAPVRPRMPRAAKASKMAQGIYKGEGAIYQGSNNDGTIDHRGVLGKLTPEQMAGLLVRIDAMFKKPVAELTTTLKKRWLIMNILLAEYGALASSQIAVSPKDTAAFMSSSTEAVQQVVDVPEIAAIAAPIAPDHAANGNGAHAPNEQASSITIFRRQQGLM